jgi:Zn-dependent M28 family amino/carboxypeptidase
LPSPLMLMALAVALLLGAAIARVAGVDATWLALAQLLPTVALLVATALLLDVSLSSFSPGANDPASGAAVALALVAGLDAAPPRNLAVELVLAGASEGPALGMRGFVRARRRMWRADRTIVVNLAACGRGRPRWWVSDGLALPLAFHPRLVAICRRIAAEEPELGAAAYRGRWASAAYPARAAGWPAITIGCLDADDIAPGSHSARDTADRVDPASLQSALQFAVDLVDELDAELDEER